MLTQTLRLLEEAYVVASHRFSSIFVRLALVWLIWRIWTFTCKPWLKPRRPKELPYTIPFLGQSFALMVMARAYQTQGHLFSFWWDSGSVIDAAAEITKNTQEPVAVYILGIKLYFVFDPSHVLATFRNGSTLSWDRFLDELLVLFGVDRAAINDSLHRHNAELKDFYSLVTSRPVKKMTLRHFTEALYMRQLAVDKADELSVAFFQCFLESSKMETILFKGEGAIRMSLQDLVDRTVSRSVAHSLFGSIIFELENDFTKHTLSVADQMWRVVYHYPKWLAPDFYNAYEHVMVAIERFAHLEPHQLSSASFMVRTMLEAEKLYDLDSRSAACLVCMMYIAAFSNVQATTFWLLAYLLSDHDLYTAIQRETSPAFRDGILDTNYITQDCPLLMSTYSEVLRLHISSNSVRVVAAPTTFGDRILEPGNILMVPFGYMHRNPRAWGDEHSKFNPMRFMTKSKAQATNNPSYRPFGAGSNSCPGKALAIRQVLASVACLMYTYDLDAPRINGREQSRPVAHHATPTIGTSVPKGGKDLVVELTPTNLEPIRHIIATTSF